MMILQSARVGEENIRTKPKSPGVQKYRSAVKSYGQEALACKSKIVKFSNPPVEQP